MRLTLMLLSATPIAAYDNGMARTPPMGWNSWCTDSLCNLAGHDPCSEHMVRTTADAMVEQGMSALGYKYVTLDDCWSAKTRDADGRLQPEPKAFPNGMKNLSDYVHSKGLLFGVYTCVGTKTCKGDRPGSYGHYERDAQTLASWGVDMIKMDHCGTAGTGNQTDRELYGEMSRALNATGRPITFSLCQWGEAEVWEWGASVAQMYRVQMDHLPFYSMPTKADGAGIGQGVVQIVEWMAKLQPSKWVAQYGWMDPDFLMTLYPTMDVTASRTEFSFWSMWSAPLLVSTDVRRLSPRKRALLLNEEVVAIDQDASNTGADRVRHDLQSGLQLWARPLANGDRAALLFNSGRRPIANATVEWAEVGWPTDARVRVRDLWAKQDVGVFASRYTMAHSVGPRDVALLRLARVTES